MRHCARCRKVLNKKQIKFCSRKCSCASYRKRHPTYGDDWPEARKVVLKRDWYACRVCGIKKSQLPKGGLHVHHITPFKLGGSHDPENLITLCRKHHYMIERGLLTVKGRTFTEIRRYLENDPRPTTRC